MYAIRSYYELRYIALTAVQGDEASIAPAVGGRSAIPLEELGRIWTGKAYLLWRNFVNIPNINTAGIPLTLDDEEDAYRVTFVSGQSSLSYNFV